MPILEPAPVTRQRCERCLGEHPHRWLVTFDRPEDAWAECLSCSGITIWCRGSVDRPPAASGLPLPPGAIAALLHRAAREREASRAAAAQLRAELRRTEAELARLTGFVDRFRGYQRRLTGCGEIADNLCGQAHHALSSAD